MSTLYPDSPERTPILQSRRNQQGHQQGTSQTQRTPLDDTFRWLFSSRSHGGRKDRASPSAANSVRIVVRQQDPLSAKGQCRTLRKLQILRSPRLLRPRSSKAASRKQSAFLISGPGNGYGYITCAKANRKTSFCTSTCRSQSVRSCRPRRNSSS